MKPSSEPPALVPARGEISVVIVNFNGAEHLPHCLDAVFRQSEPFGEVLVIDNASSDGSERAAQARHPSLGVVRLPKNLGPCPARNTGLATARHDWVLLLDNDAVLLPDTLARLADAARAHPEASVLQPRSVFASDPGRVHYDGGSFHYVGLFALRNFFVPLEQAEGRGTLPVDGAVSVALLVRRERLLAIGGFDPDFFILFEDLDLSLRLRGEGQEILSVEDALVHHRGGTAGISFRGAGSYPHSRAFLHARNRGLLLLKNYGWRTLVVSLPGLALYELAWFCLMISNGSAPAYLRGRWALFLALPRTLSKRRGIRRARRVRDRDLLVGGPLTITPGLGTSPLRAAILRRLDAGLRTWWRLVRRLAS